MKISNKVLVRNIRKFLKEDCFFVNIGANDGVTNDPVFPFIQHFAWRGIEVEPQPDLFLQLKQNLASFEGIIFENVAISSEDLTFYKVSDDLIKLEPALSQLSSFNKTHIENFLKLLNAGKVQDDALTGVPLPHLAEMIDGIESLKILTMGFNNLMEKHGVTRIDFLNIDVESHDYRVFMSIDFDRYAPKVLCIETLGFSSAERENFLSVMEKYGYVFLQKFGLPSEIYVRK